MRAVTRASISASATAVAASFVTFHVPDSAKRTGGSSSTPEYRPTPGRSGPGRKPSARS